MAAPMNFSAYAKYRGVSQPYISQLVAQGVIPLVPGKKMIDPEAADRAIEEHRDISKNYTVDRNAAERAAKSGVPADDHAEVPTSPNVGGRPQNAAAVQIRDAHSKARAMRETFVARSAELDYRQRVGELVEKSAVERGVGAVAASMRSAVQRLPDMLASRLAAESDARKVRALLAAEIERVLQDLAGEITAIPEQLTATQQ